MIPTLILFGLVFGRWWRTSFVVAAIGWPVVLVVDGAMKVEPGLGAAAVLAAVNAGVGIVVHQAVLRSVRVLRRAGASTPTS